jgi:NAD(P)-dependent dehydrogenase (short-subunit alcohol dehydrogenase family)
MEAKKSESRFVVITGATRGLGRALVKEMSGLGHVVAGCGRSAGAIADLNRVPGTPHSFEVVDVRSDEAVRAWADAVLKKHGPPDLLLNNAAVINRNAPLWKIPASEFDEVVGINLSGVANVLRHFLPAMVSRRRGVIVNFSSGWGRSADADVAPYCTTKWGIEGLTRALANELPKGMAAVPLNPGIIDTDMLRSCFGGSAAGYSPPETWAKSAAPFLLRLGPADNGRPLTAPG